jgi:hypothetical protein
MSIGLVSKPQAPLCSSTEISAPIGGPNYRNDGAGDCALGLLCANSASKRILSSADSILQICSNKRRRTGILLSASSQVRSAKLPVNSAGKVHFVLGFPPHGPMSLNHMNSPDRYC